jgi:hypothetical protein
MPNVKCCDTKATAVCGSAGRAAPDEFCGSFKLRRISGQSPLPADARICPIRPIGPIHEDREGRQTPYLKHCHAKATAVSEGATRAASVSGLAEIRPSIGADVVIFVKALQPGKQQDYVGQASRRYRPAYVPFAL